MRPSQSFAFKRERDFHYEAAEAEERAEGQTNVDNISCVRSSRRRDRFWYLGTEGSAKIKIYRAENNGSFVLLQDLDTIA